jgi:translation initiation factor 4A
MSDEKNESTATPSVVPETEQPEPSLEQITGDEVKEVEEVEEEEEQEQVITVCETFDEMGLKDDLLRGIYSHGFEKPSTIQQRGILPFCTGSDIIAQSQSGTGKTGTFSIGLLQRIDVTQSTTQALVLAPTRELAKQIYNVIGLLGGYLDGLKRELAIGGVKSKYGRWGDGDECSHVVIGTPGRVLDNLQRKRLRADHIKVLVLDEADEMLSRGFIDQVYNIFQHVPNETQVALFSATMPVEVLGLTQKFMQKPIRILVKQEELTLEGIRQFYVCVDKRPQKIDVIFDLFGVISVTQCIIYANTKRMAEDLHHYLTEEQFSVGIITGNMEQEDRNRVMKDFRQGQTRVLIATDMLARGIDVQQVSLVVNFDLPREKETYIHRIGRSGRFGRKGTAINLVTADEYQYIKELEAFYATQIEELPSNVADLI